MIHDAVKSSDEELQQDICSSLVLSGGNTLLKGFVPRVQHEIEKSLPHH